MSILNKAPTELIFRPREWTLNRKFQALLVNESKPYFRDGGYSADFTQKQTVEELPGSAGWLYYATIPLERVFK